MSSAPPNRGSTSSGYREDGVTSARDVFITVYGRIPVLEALRNPAIPVEKVLLADTATGTSAAALLRAAAVRQVPVTRVPRHRVAHLSRNGRQDQGVVADVRAPNMHRLDAWIGTLDRGTLARVLILDGVSTPGNVGMILRTATAAGIDQIVLPRVGAPDLGPMVIKASAGVAFIAPILRCATPVDGMRQLRDAGFTLYGLRTQNAESIFDRRWPRRAALVLGGETAGVSGDVADLIDSWVGIPHAGPVESLNVAAAAAVLTFELMRTRPRG